MLKYDQPQKHIHFIMQHLAQYVGAIHQPKQYPALHIIRHETQHNTQHDDGLAIQSSLEYFYFNDGSIIQKDTEQDNQPVEVEACSECWIQYQVLQQPQGAQITPTKIQFNSHCREQYWVRYFK